MSFANTAQHYRKHLATDYQIDDLLDTCADGRNVIRAEHFFWIVGEAVQKSREGLLRHLLHSSLLSLPPSTSGEDPDLIELVCGRR